MEEKNDLNGTGINQNSLNNENDTLNDGQQELEKQIGNEENASQKAEGNSKEDKDINPNEKPKLPASIRIKVVGAIVIALSSLLIYGIFSGTETKQPEKKPVENAEVNLEEQRSEVSSEMEFPDTYQRKKTASQGTSNNETFVFENKYPNAPISDNQYIPITMEKELGKKVNPILQEYYANVYNDELNARKSEISFPNMKASTSSNSSNSSSEIPSFPSSQPNPFAEPDMNRQADKKQFFRNEEQQKIYNSGRELYAVSPYEVKAGTYIPGVLVSGINSDLPGNMKGQVREDVYDTVTGNHLLIPKGTTLIGTYDSGVTFGQTRALVVWQRLIFPNGKTVLLDNMGGVDLSGYAGFKDKVDNHNLQLFKAVVLSSILGAGTAIVSEDDDDNDNWKSEAGRGAGEQVIMIGNRMADKLLSLQPTITIRPGYRFNIMLHSDLVLTPYER